MGLLALLYGFVSYVMFLGVFLYAIGFVGNMVVPKTIDSGAAGSLGQAILINLVLLGLFAIQHNVMARPWFKKAWTQLVPTSIERSTYVLLSNLLLILLFWKWQPMPEAVWSVENMVARGVLWALFAIGWALVPISTFLTGHFDLFGMRQVMARFRGADYWPPKFSMRGLYKLVRHPLLLGFVIAFWATPEMSQGHLLFAVVTTVWILLSIRWEEHDLTQHHGDDYREYRRRVSMILPIPKHKG